MVNCLYIQHNLCVELSVKVVFSSKIKLRFDSHLLLVSISMEMVLFIIINLRFFLRR
jgi:hypothetical protein